MVIVQLMGGLGNQLFQYALGRRIALAHHVPLKLDIFGFDTMSESDTPRRYELHHFTIAAGLASQAEVALVTGANRLGLQGRLWRFLPARRPYYKRAWVKQQGFPFDPNILKVSKNVYLSGWWTTEKYFKDIEPVIRQDFTLKYPLEGINAELAVRIQTCDSVSLHIRRGDYISNPITHQFHGVCSLEYYLTAIARLKEQIKAPHFFVFSDDIQWGKEHLRLEDPGTFVDHNGGEKNYEDLRLMSRCKHHIIANSTFSWWGAWLSTHPEKIVFAPKKWFRDPSVDARDVCPESWHRL